MVQSPVEMPEDLVSGLDNWYATICRQCPTGEGLVVRVMEGRAKKVEGNVDYPINRGKHSVRCEAGLQALYHPDRVRGPLVREGERGSGRFEEISWTDAIGRLTYQLSKLRDQGNQDQMVMVTDPLGAHLGQVVERFVSRYGGQYMPYEAVERTTLRAAVKATFDQDVIPEFDIENANYVLSFGCDFLNTWLSPVRYARGYGHFRQGDNRERGTLVHVDSRFSMTAANADRWLHVRPGMEGVLALSIAQVIIAEGLGDSQAARDLTGGGYNLDLFAPENVTQRVGVPAGKIREVAIEFAKQRPSVAFGGGSAAAHTNGLFNLVAVYSLNYLVGSVGERGGVLFNPLPALGDVPSAPAAASFADWQHVVAQMQQGRIRALLVRGADPWYGLPDAVGFKDATFNVPLIVSFSGIVDDTAAMADLILPEHSFLEEWGADVPDPGPGYQVVGFQQPAVRPLFEARGTHLGTRGFADVLMTVAQGLEIDLGLPGETFKDILQDGARQLFEMDRGSVRAPDFKSFWNGLLQRGGWWDVSAKSADKPPPAPRLPKVEEPEFFPQESAQYPFHLVPFVSTSLGDGRGASLPWMQATPDPITTATWQTWVEINIRTAEAKDIKEGDVIAVSSAYGRIEALAFPHPGMPPDVVSIPLGQGHQAGGRYAEGRGSNPLSILAPSMDGKTGALAWAATRVKIEKTDRWIRLPKFENAVPNLPTDEHREIIQIATRDS